jgi:Asp-tRNA(Asn)/Glu-tRNA(Gln) amidotransferase C subunit
LDALAEELAVILDAAARISEVATDDVPPMTHAVSMVNVTPPTSSSTACLVRTSSRRRRT